MEWRAIDGCEAVEGRCKRPLMTKEKGTIMSYCHLYQNGASGIDFSKGFGLQPGNLMRYNVKRARIKCLEIPTECGQDLELANTLSGYISHKVKNKISSSSTIGYNSVVNLKGKQIILTNGFNSSGYDNSIFKASVEPCNQFSYEEKEDNIKNKKEEKIKMEISPNPSSGIFKIILNKAIERDIKVINLDGIAVYSESFKGMEFDINISNKPNGVYIIIIKTGSKSISEKIIKN